MKNKINEIVEQLSIYLFIILVNFFSITKTTDGDIFFDIRSARDLLKYGLDFKDHMSMFDGFRYLYHHYLYDLIIYPIFNLGGIQAIFLLGFILSSALLILIYVFLKNKTNNKIVSLFATIILTIILGSTFLPKIKIVNFLLMFIQFITIYNLYTKGKVRYSVISIVLSILLVNLHFPLWFMVPIFYLPYLAQMLYTRFSTNKIFKYFNKRIIVNKCSNHRMFLITFIIIMLSGFISPFKLLPYTFIFDVMPYQKDVYSFIGEMHHVILIERIPPLLCFSYSIIFMLTNKKISFSNLCYLLGLGLFGILVVRNLPYLYIYYIVIITWSLFEGTKDNTFKFIKKINKPFFYSSMVIVELVILIINIKINGFTSFYIDGDISNLPIKTVNYIIDNTDYHNIKMYNDFSIGSYLAYRDIPVFVDTRVEVYLKRFNQKQDVLNDCFNMRPKELLEKYHFDYVLATYNTEMYYYMIDNNYTLLYSEKDFYFLFKNEMNK